MILSTLDFSATPSGMTRGSWSCDWDVIFPTTTPADACGSDRKGGFVSRGRALTNELQPSAVT